MAARGSLLFVDAYDSFSENIAALLRQHLNVEITVTRIDTDISQQFHQTTDQFFAKFDGIVLGPGPGNPNNEQDVGLFRQVWDFATRENTPVLAICLGFQSLCLRYGLPIARMPMPCHGHAKQIIHTNSDIFGDVGDVVATNYNSLGVRLKSFASERSLSRQSSSGSMRSNISTQSFLSATSAVSRPIANSRPGFNRCVSSDQVRDGFSDALDVLGWDKDGWVMAVRHKALPFYGLQFHPESCKSNEACRTLIGNWWEQAEAHNSLLEKLSPTHLYRTASLGATEYDNTAIQQVEAAANLLQELGQHACNVSTWKSQRKVLDRTSLAHLCEKLSQTGATAIFESTKRGRYSIYSFPDPAAFQIEFAAGTCTFIQNTSVVGRYDLSREKLLQLVEEFVCSKQIEDDGLDIPFRGGFMGYLSYEFGVDQLRLNVHPHDKSRLQTPDVGLIWIERSVVYDHETNTVYVQSIRKSDAPWMESMLQNLELLADGTLGASLLGNESEIQQGLKESEIHLPDHDTYISRIRECQLELLSGNSYELCLTTEAQLHTPSSMAPFSLYSRLQQHNPVPYAGYLHLNRTHIISSSPEQFLSWTPSRSDAPAAGTIDMKPMKGTVRKSPSMTFARASSILASAKESAENLMIADLIRHDLQSVVGRTAPVEVVDLCKVVETETVYQLISHVRAHVPPASPTDHTAETMRYGMRALHRSVPPGSMTGAPKKRSCEILHRLEQRDRGIYAGVMGYMDVGGRGQWSVCIRTLFCNEGDNEVVRGKEMRKWRIGAGGAITVLSDEEGEWDEMRTKLDSVLAAFRTA